MLEAFDPEHGWLVVNTSHDPEPEAARAAIMAADGIRVRIDGKEVK